MLLLQRPYRAIVLQNLLTRGVLVLNEQIAVIFAHLINWQVFFFLANLTLQGSLLYPRFEVCDPPRVAVCS